MHKNLRDLEQYSSEKCVTKCVYKGKQSEAILVFLSPGQTLPAHSHKRFEVVLLPQKGRGMMKVDEKKDIELLPGVLYYEPAGCTFLIQNTSESPFELLITLVRIDQPETPPPHETSESGELFVSTSLPPLSSIRLEYQQA